jgi:hypothetical protein
MEMRTNKYLIINQAFRRKIQRPVLTVMALMLTIMGLCSVGGTAYADVRSGQVTDVYMNLPDDPNFDMQSQYYGLIDSLRRAAGHQFRDGIPATQSQPIPGRTRTGLIRLTLSNRNAHLVLWITPADLYVRGFTNTYGQTFQFNDGDYQLFDHLQTVGINVAPGQRRTLPFGSNYNSLSANANRERQQMPLSWTDLYRSWYNLAYGGSWRNIARSLMFMIQYTSESARFWDVYGIMARITSTRNAYYNGLPVPLVYLENRWNRISIYGFDVTYDRTGPREINNVGVLNGWRDVVRYCAILLNHNNRNLPQEGPKGAYRYTEF